MLSVGSKGIIMADFEGLDSAWERLEQARHEALLRQLKAEIRAFRRQTLATRSVAAVSTVQPLPPPPEPVLIKRPRS